MSKNICSGNWWQLQKLTIQIAGNSLEPIYHNIISNYKCDGLKTDWIGKSAAKAS